MQLDYDLQAKTEAVSRAYKHLSKTAAQVVGWTRTVEQEARSTGRISQDTINSIFTAYQETINAHNEATRSIIALANSWFE